MALLAMFVLIIKLRLVNEAFARSKNDFALADLKVPKLQGVAMRKVENLNTTTQYAAY